MSPLRSKDSELILGYRLIERLGAGGFGEVWKAEAPGGLLKAVKFVYGEMSGRQASQEIKALERIKEVRHPFVLSLERAEIVDGQLIMVTELADGTLLDRFEVCRSGPEGAAGIPREELLLYLRDAAEALDFLSSQFHLQHLDVKPSNLFLIGAHLKVGDFGLVREICHRTAMSMGGLTPIYAAPEMFTGRFSPYTDQYALAIVFQEMLTGTRPFRGRTSVQLSEQTLRASPILVALSVADQGVIRRALSKNPNDRFPTCGEMIRTLTSNSTEEARPASRERPPEADREEPLLNDPEPGYLPPLRDDEILLLDHPSEPTAPASEPLGSPTPAEMDLSGQSLGFAQEESREPTLFVGIGGLAGGVLSQLKHLFASRSGRSGGRRPLGWLLLDTDRAALQRVCSPDLAGKLEAEETVFMPLHSADHYQPKYKQLLGWLGRHWLYRIPRSKCVEGIRALGRLALVDNGEDVMTQLRQAVRQVASSIADDAERARFQIMVIASISGGTASGCLLDIGFALRRILLEEGLAEVPVASVLILASSVRKEGKELAHANAYVTVSELHSFLDSDCRFPGAKALGLSPQEGHAALFDNVVLVNFGDLAMDADSVPGTNLLAEYIHLHRGTPCARLAKQERSIAGDETCVTRIRRFRLARFGFPRAELVRVISREVCLRMIRSWLQGPASETAIAASPPFSLVPRQPAGLRQDGASGTVPSPVPLDEEAFYEVVLERLQRASGWDPLEFLEQKTQELLEYSGKEERAQALNRFYDELDDRFGSRTEVSTDPSAATRLHGKLRDEFHHDRVELESKLESWIRRIVDQPGPRVITASDRLQRLARDLSAQIDATPSRIKKLQVQRAELRDRRLAVSGSTRPSLANRLKPLHRERTSQTDEVYRYGQFWIHELAYMIRGEILAGLLAKVRQLEEAIAQLRLRIEGVGRLFLVGDRELRTSMLSTLGRSVDVLRARSVGRDELGSSLTDAFCSDRRLGDIERRLQEEVLEAHGGLVAVMGREPRFATQLFQDDLFQRVAQGVEEWLEGWDAASVLLQRQGTAEGAVREMIEFLRSAPPEITESPTKRVILAFPSSPSGRSLRELLANRGGTGYITDYVAIPDDLVLCLESEDLDLATVAAAMVSEHPWIEDLAPKLVSRKDVAWASLFGTIQG